MAVNLDNKLVVAISSRALFDLAESHAIYEAEGLDAYRQYQIERENTVLEVGDAFGLVQKLLHINKRLAEPRVEIILLSRNSADTGLRVFKSIEHYGLNITRAAFCGGQSPYRYIRSFGCHLFLSTDGDDVRKALDAGVAAATLLPSVKKHSADDELRIAFDGDAVLFSDESERIYQQEGLAAFSKNEAESANLPMSGGPFKDFLGALQQLQNDFDPSHCPIRTALVTARSAPAHERVIKTLRAWDIRIDESLFLGGLSKASFLKDFGADVFFDDQEGHLDGAREHVAAAHVPHGVANLPTRKQS